MSIKKITYIKYSGTLELGCHLVYTSGSQDLRTRLFREFLAAGIQINVQTVFSKNTLEYLETNHAKEYFNLDKMSYRPNSLEIDSDTDLLLVESGSGNCRFETDLIDENCRVPSVCFANMLIKKFKGLCFYLQIDVALDFVFFPERFSKEYVRTFLHRADYKDLFQDKRWVILSPAKEVQEFSKHSNSLRTSYNELYQEGLIDIDRFEFHYCGIDWEEEKYEIVKNPINSLLYIGGERNRTKKLKELYWENRKMMDTIIYGKWDEETIKKFKDENFHFKGKLEAGKTREMYNKYFGSVIIGDIKYEKVKCVSGRLFEVTTAKTLPIIDADLRDTTVSDIFDDLILDILCVKERKDVASLLELKDSQERVDLIEECVSQMSKFTPTTSLHLFVDLYEKYKNGKPTDMEKVQEVFIERNLSRQKEELDEFTEMIFTYHKLI